MKSVLKLAFLEPKFRKHILWGITGTFFFKVFDIIPEILLGLMVDVAIRQERSFLFQNHFSKDLSTIFLFGGIALFIWAMSNFFHFLSLSQWKRAAIFFQFQLRMELCRYILTHKKISSTSEIVTLRDDDRVTNRAIDIVEFFVNNTLEEFFRLLFSTLIIGPILFIIAPVFLLYALISLLPIFLASFFLQKKISPLYESVKKTMRLMYREIDELISGVSIIKDFGIENRFYKKVEVKAVELKNENDKVCYLSSAIIPFTRIFIQIGLIGILIHGAILIFNGQLSFGAFAAASFLSRKFLLPFSFLGGFIDRFIKGMGSVKEISIKLRKHSSLIKEDIYYNLYYLSSIQMKGINYFYGDKKILHDIHVEFKPEQLNVIKGPSGSGKTTLLRLLLRNFSINSRRNLNNFINIDQYAWQKKIAFVPQFPKLFTASILDNITLFDSQINQVTLQKALDISLTLQFINDFPNGIDSIVGFNGIKLSGGQMQSIALARAFYTDAKIFLLDEPTSAFDLEREKLFLEGLRKNLKGKLIIMTSHRTQSINAADFLFDLNFN